MANSAKPNPERELASRLVRLTALRLGVLIVFLGFVTLVYLRGQTGGFSSSVAFATVALAFTLAALFAAILRRGRALNTVALGQILTDQLLWTAIVYVTGGVTSGAVSLYGLTCVAGAIARGVRGALTAFFAASACYVVLAVLLIEQILRLPEDQSRAAYVLSWADAAYPMLANIVALGFVAGLSGYLAERLRTAGGELVKAEKRAEQAEQLASLGRLAAGLAHEIRNPLGGIAGAIELLGESPHLTEEDRQLCTIVQREASRLNDLVDDMLHLSRAREPTLEVVDLVRLARDVVTLSGRWRGEDVRIVLRGDDSVLVRADPAQTRQMLWNLVRNAVQASGAGEEIVVRLLRSDDGAVELAVIDHGVGIPSEALDKLFDAFFTTRSHGTGVGLAVVKRIVDAHGWSIEVTSLEGATFRVRVPPSSVVESSDAENKPARDSSAAVADEAPGSNLASVSGDTPVSGKPLLPGE